jgi:hypothetical protein
MRMTIDDYVTFFRCPFGYLGVKFCCILNCWLCENITKGAIAVSVAADAYDDGKLPWP